LRFQLAAPPSSTTAAGSSATDCAKAFAEERNNDANSRGFVAFTLMGVYQLFPTTIHPNFNPALVNRRSDPSVNGVGSRASDIIHYR